MNQRKRKFFRNLTALTLLSAFLFEQVVWAYPMSTAKSLGVAMVEQGVAIGVAKTFDNPIIAAAVSSAVAGGLRGEDIFSSAMTGATIAGVNQIGEKNNWDPALTNVAAMTAGSLNGKYANMEYGVKS